MTTNKLQSSLLAVVLVGAASAANAQIIGQLYENTGSSPWPTPNVGSSGADANAPIPSGLLPNVTFSVPNGALNFQSGQNGVPYTVGGFLASGGAMILTGAGEAGNTDDNTIITMEGLVTVVNGQTYETEHDDGLELTIGGVNVVDMPGPTAAESTPFTWTGASGTYAFSLEYSEENTAPAVLQTDLPLAAAAPDSTTTMGLLGISLSALGALGRRFKK